MPLSPLRPRIDLRVSFGAAAGHTPVDGATYYFAEASGLNPGTSDGAGAQVPYDAIINSVRLRFFVFGTPGSNENNSVYLRKNSATDSVAITTTMQLTAATVDISATALNFSISSGDTLYVKWVCPTFVTNPTTMFCAGHITLELTN